MLTGRPMVEYPEARRHIDEKFAKFGREPTPSNYKQALFPEGTRLIPNPLGTAPGALVEWDGTLFATLPGVPSEMKRMFEETLEPLIRERSDGSIVSKTLHFAGIGESALAEKVQDFLDASDPTVAPLAGQGRVRLRITTRAATEEEAHGKIRPVEREILDRLGEYFFGEDGETLEGSVGRLLSERGATVALAESCTGGLISKRLTDVAGSSCVDQGNALTGSGIGDEVDAVRRDPGQGSALRVEAGQVRLARSNHDLTGRRPEDAGPADVASSQGIEQ